MPKHSSVRAEKFWYGRCFEQTRTNGEWQIPFDDGIEHVKSLHLLRIDAEVLAERGNGIGAFR